MNFRQTLDALNGRHNATVHALRQFRFDHLPPHLRAISQPFFELACGVVEQLPDGPELTAGLRKLVEAKDCMVRAAVDAEEAAATACPSLTVDR